MCSPICAALSPSPSPVATTTDDASETIALIGEDMWRFRQTVAAVFAAHPEVLETDAEKLEVSLAPDTSVEDAAALIAAVRAEVSADAAECGRTRWSAWPWARAERWRPSTS